SADVTCYCTLSLHDALPIFPARMTASVLLGPSAAAAAAGRRHTPLPTTSLIDRPTSWRRVTARTRVGRSVVATLTGYPRCRGSVRGCPRPGGTAADGARGRGVDVGSFCKYAPSAPDWPATGAEAGHVALGPARGAITTPAGNPLEVVCFSSREQPRRDAFAWTPAGAG